MGCRIRSKGLVALAGAGMALLLSASSGESDVGIDPRGIRFPGTLVGAGIESAVFSTPQGSASLPSGSAVYEVNGRLLDFARLRDVAPGTPVGVRLLASDVLLRSVAGGVATVALSDGTLLRLPDSAIPLYTRKKIKVYARLRNGDVVRVPLHAAMNMQRAQGATILTGLSPAEATAFAKGTKRIKRTKPGKSVRYRPTLGGYDNGPPRGKDRLKNR